MDPITTAYQQAGGTLTSNAIPTSYIDAQGNTANQTSAEAYKRLTGKDYTSIAGTMTSPAVVTSDRAVSTTTRNQNDLNTGKTSLSTTPPPTPINPESTVDYNNLTEAQARSLFGTNFTGVGLNKDGTFAADYTALARIGKDATGKSTSDTTKLTPPDFSSIGVDSVTQQALADSKALAARLDASTKTLIDGINREYEGLIASQKVANQAYEGGTNIENIRSGRSRYAPTIAMGQMNAVVQSGIKAISDLEAKKAQLVSQAQVANDEQQYKMLNDYMTQYRSAVKEQRQIAQDTYQNAITFSQNARAEAEEKRKADKTSLDNTAPTIAKALAGITDEATINSYIQSYAEKTGLDPVALKSAVVNYNNTQNEKVNTTINNLAKDFPDAGITTADIQGSDLQAVLKKVTNSASYKRKTDQEKAETMKTYYEAEKAKKESQPYTGSYAAESHFIMNNGGKLPPGMKSGTPEADAAYKMAILKAKDEIPDGTIVESTTGFQVEPSRVPSGIEDRVSKTKVIENSLPQLREFLAKHTTYPGGKYVQGAGKLANLTSDEVQQFNNIVGQITASYANSVSGTAVNEKEYMRLTNLVPNSNEWNSYNIQKLNDFEDLTKNTIKRTLGSYGATIKGMDLTPVKEKQDDIKKFTEEAKKAGKTDAQIDEDLKNIGLYYYKS